MTLRGARMWEFVDRLISIAIPRIRDFRGLNPRSFDGRGNYSLGIREQLIFPEIDYDSIDEVRGLDVTITTSAATDEEAFELLLALGIPVLARRAGRARSTEEDEEEERRQEEARERAEAEAAALEQLKEENPEAYAKPVRRGGGRGGRGGPRRARAPSPRTTRGDDEDSERKDTWRRPHRVVRQQRKPKYKTPRVQPLPPVRAAARLLPQVRPVPAVPARARAQRLHPRNDQVELVNRSRPDADRPDLRLPDPRSQRARRAARRRGDARLAAEEGDHADPRAAGLHHRLRRRAARGRRGDPDQAQVHGRRAGR